MAWILLHDSPGDPDPEDRIGRERRSNMEANTVFRPMALASVAVALSLAGCSSTGIFGGDSNDDDRTGRDDRITEVDGRVESVDTRDSIIVVEPSGVYRSQLRNDDEQRIELRYDDSTVVEYDGRIYRPDALEAGDRIAADVDDDGDRLYARQIEVTFDVTTGSRDPDDGDRTADRDGDSEITELRGKVRWLDDDLRIFELEDTSWGWGAGGDDRRDDVVEIHYDADTVVEYGGRRFAPRDLERGDEVQVELRDSGSRYVAEEITVIANVRD
jgi:hypothetical protein